MSRNLIFQYYVNLEGPRPEYVDLSISKFKEYAKHVGAEYLFKDSLKFIQGKKPHPHHIYFEWLRLIYEPYWEQYDKILFVDTDVIPEKLDNIFDQKIEHVGMVAERHYRGMNGKPGFSRKHNQGKWPKLLTFMKEKGHYEMHNGEKFWVVYNSGVMLWSKEGRKMARNRFKIWREWYTQMSNFPCEKQLTLDQPYLNTQLHKIVVTELPLKWNCYPRVKWDDKKFPKDAVFVHYTSKKKQDIIDIYEKD